MMGLVMYSYNMTTHEIVRKRERKLVVDSHVKSYDCTKIVRFLNISKVQPHLVTLHGITTDFFVEAVF